MYRHRYNHPCDEEIRTHCDDHDTDNVTLVPDVQMEMEYCYNVQPSVSDSGVE
jgi:hypothetical protein